MRQRRLCDVHGFGSARKIELFRESGEIAQVAELHESTLPDASPIRTIHLLMPSIG
jgi:hypothetical protein